MTDDSARIVRLEMTVQQHADLLVRAVESMESQTVINERLANHMSDLKRIWSLMEAQGERLAAVELQQVEICTFCATTRKIGWAVMVFLSGGLAYLIDFWARRHGN